MMPFTLRPLDALVVVDMQNDFVSGTLPVPDAASIVPVMNRFIDEFHRRGLAIIATRDWHPSDHTSFREQGGPWPSHCVAGTPGAGFVPELELPEQTVVVSKAASPEHDAYSGFEGTELDGLLRERLIRRVFIGGLATEYCVINTVRDALRRGNSVFLLTDAIRAVNVHPEDGARAEREMRRAGALPLRIADLATFAGNHG